MLLNCKFCGGELEIAENDKITTCKYCRTTQTLPVIKEEHTGNLFNRANALRRRCDFDKAEAAFEKLIEADGTEAEAYWGLVLSKYGIEYVEDPESGKMLPTCHRASYDSIASDGDYKSALEYADEERKAIYIEQAKKIDRIQKDIINLAQNEESYDVFICYKETDENGKRTRDSVFANELYHQYTQEGFKVFYAAITLEGKLGRDYEPIIFAALNSAKVMLVIGSKPEYFNAVWVKNEWSRFLKIMKKDRKKLLIPCYRDMDPYDLPEEFSHLQAQDLNKFGSAVNILNGIHRVMEAFKPKPEVIVKEKETVLKETVVKEPTVKETVVLGAGIGINTESLIKRAFMFLEDGDFESADEYCEKVLDLDPENVLGYLGKLMAELKVKKRAALKEFAEPFDTNINYKKVIRFGDKALKTELMGYIDFIKIRNENARLEGIYKQATKQIKSAKTESDCREASKLFESISEYKDSAVLAKTCLEKIDELWKAEIARKAAAKRAKAEAEAKRLEQQHERWLANCAREAAERRAKIKKITIITVSIILAVALIAFLLVLNFVIMPNIKYNEAVALMEAGKYTEALSTFEKYDWHKDSKTQIKECKYQNAVLLLEAGKYTEANSIFKEIHNYKDSEEKLGDIRLINAKESLKNVKVGDSIKFGAYEQDNSTSNGKEDIEWQVLEIKDGKALVISKYVLDGKMYNDIYNNVTWETCTLRKWLNNDFLNSAFGGGEKKIISTTTVSSDRKEACTTQDNVFLLSFTEVKQYFASNNKRKCESTTYADLNGTSSGFTNWWLRSAGSDQTNAAIVKYDGTITTQIIFSTSINNSNVNECCGVRPVMWIDLNA